MKKLISLLVVLAMAVTLAVPAAAADNVGSTMRLESTEGSVTVKNASGLSVKQSDKMRLYDGYSVETKASSYAYISLDGDKTLKLDASSEASVSKSGKKLEITLVTGSLFFNVSKPLETSESLNIRTSTMVTGVRGTSACVSVPNRNHTEITLLTGHLEVTGRDSHSGEMETVEMAAGEHVVVAQLEVGTPQEHLDIQKQDTKEQELPGFVAVEVAADPELQTKISTETTLSVPLIIGDAEERLAADQSAAQQEKTAVQQQLEQQEQAETITPVFEETPSSSDSSDSDSSDSDSDSGPSGSSQTPESADLHIGSEQELQNALASNTPVVNLYIDSSGQPLDSGSPLTVPTGKTLNLRSGVWNNDGEVVIQGSVYVYAGSTLQNNGALSVLSTYSLHVSGHLVNSGSVSVGSSNAPGFAEITGTFQGNPNSYFTVAAGSTLRLAGGGISAASPLTISPGGSVSLDANTGLALWLSSTVTVSSPYTNHGETPVSVRLQNSAEIKNCTVTISGEHAAASPAMTNSVPEGETFSFTLTPDAGFSIGTVTCGGQPLTPDASGAYTVGPVTGDLTVTVTAEPVVPTYTVTIEGDHFNASPDKTNSVKEGSTFTFTLTPDEGYAIVSVDRGGVILMPDGGAYSVGPVTGDLTVTVTAESTTVDLTNPTMDQLGEVLDKTWVETINITNTNTASLVVTKEVREASDPPLMIPAGKTLNLKSGKFTFIYVGISGAVTTAPGTTLIFEHPTGNEYGSTMVADGGVLTVNGSMVMNSSGQLYNVGDLTINGSAQINSGANLTNDGVTPNNEGPGEMAVYGQLTVSGESGSSGTLSNGGTLTVESGGALTVSDYGKLTNKGTLTVSGSMTTGSNSELCVGWTDGTVGVLEITGSGPIIANGPITVYQGSTVTAAEEAVGGMNYSEDGGTTSTAVLLSEGKYSYTAPGAVMSAIVTLSAL